MMVVDVHNRDHYGIPQFENPLHYFLKFNLATISQNMRSFEFHYESAISIAVDVSLSKVPVVELFDEL